MFNNVKMKNEKKILVLDGKKNFLPLKTATV